MTLFQKTILVIDDESSIRDTMKLALDSFGYHILTAENGLVGLEIFRQSNPVIDIVFLDMVLPKLSGEKVLDEMLLIDPDVKVIVTSGHSSDEYNSSFLDKIKLYLEKPFDIGGLDLIVRSVLDS